MRDRSYTCNAQFVSFWPYPGSCLMIGLTAAVLDSLIFLLVFLSISGRRAAYPQQCGDASNRPRLSRRAKSNGSPVMFYSTRLVRKIFELLSYCSS